MSRRKKQPSLSFVIISIIAASDILTWSRAFFNHYMTFRLTSNSLSIIFSSIIMYPAGCRAATCLLA